MTQIKQALPTMPALQAEQRILANNKGQRLLHAPFAAHLFERFDGI